MKGFLWLLMMVSACAAADPPDEPNITRACVRSFATTLDAWRSVVGEVPAGCAFLDAEYDVVLASSDDMPCDEPIGVNQVRTECIHGGVIYVNEAVDDVRRVEASVHGWVHALALCIDGDIDAHHLRLQLWEALSAENSVEVNAATFAEWGECL